MTDEQKVLDEYDFQEPDKMLASLVSLVNKQGATYDITFVVDGVMLTGTIVSGNEYVSSMGEIFANIAWTDDLGGKHVLDTETQQSIREKYRNIADEKYPKQRLGANSDQDEEHQVDEMVIAYIHLRNLQVVLPANNVNFNYNNQFPYWRFRLSEISGWTFGRAEKSSD